MNNSDETLIILIDY